MSIQSNIFTGNWRLLPNQAENEKGTIHDNSKAIKRGFRRGIVGGPTVAQAVFPTLNNIFKNKWLKNGWLSIKFISPVYDDEEIREVAEIIDQDSINLRIETKEKRIAMIGDAGISKSPPWNTDNDHKKGVNKAFPDINIGFTFEDINFTINQKDIILLCEGADDDNTWLKNVNDTSKAYAPPIIIFNPATIPQQDLVFSQPVDHAGMNAEFQLLIHKPLIINKAYTIKMKIVDKGIGLRTWFWTTQFDVIDKNGNHIITARQKCKWFFHTSNNKHIRS